jgi:xanthine dehydrogenase accessory factor
MKSNGKTKDPLEELVNARKAGEPVALAVIVKARGSVPRHTGSKMLIYTDGHTSGTIGGGELEARVLDQALAALKDNKSRYIPYSLVDPKRGDPGVCGGEVEVYVEPYLPPITILIIGCGHVGKAVAQLGSWLGFRIAVSDDREGLATPEAVPEADLHFPGSIDDTLASFNVNFNTNIVAVTRNVEIDREVLPKLLETDAPYIGIIGSRRRWQETRRLLTEDGFDEDQINRFHSPIGLELHAETPEEIAVSILAEVIMLHRGGTGIRMAAMPSVEGV